MPDPLAPIPPPSPESSDAPTPRQRTTVYLACTLLVLCSIVLLLLPSTRLPLPGRIALASVNLIAVAVLLLVVRQKSNDPK